jgi:hypothetical protein
MKMMAQFKQEQQYLILGFINPFSGTIHLIASWEIYDER